MNALHKLLSTCLLLSFYLLSATSSASAQSGYDWQQITPLNPSPPARLDFGYSFDSANNVTIIYGGDTGMGTNHNDTWIFDGTAWAQLTNGDLNSPPGRYGVAMTFDAANAESVMFGGVKTIFPTQETWTLKNSVWVQKSPMTNPPVRAYGSMAEHASGDANQAVILFGGLDGGASALNDTYSWDGSDWTLLSPTTSPPARYWSAMAYDAVNKQIVLFGGFNGASALRDTWIWDGTDWSDVTPGVLTDDNSPSARYTHRMAYDSLNNRILLFGGNSGVTPLDDTWVWTGSAWEKLITTTSPTARTDHSLTFDTNNNIAIVFGGLTSVDPFTQNDTWKYGPTPEPTPTPTPDPTMTPTPVPTTTATPEPSPTATATPDPSIPTPPEIFITSTSIKSTRIKFKRKKSKKKQKAVAFIVVAVTGKAKTTSEASLRVERLRSSGTGATAVDQQVGDQDVDWKHTITKKVSLKVKRNGRKTKITPRKTSFNATFRVTDSNGLTARAEASIPNINLKKLTADETPDPTATPTPVFNDSPSIIIESSKVLSEEKKGKTFIVTAEFSGLVKDDGELSSLKFKQKNAAETEDVTLKGSSFSHTVRQEVPRKRLKFNENGTLVTPITINGTLTARDTEGATGTREISVSSSLENLVGNEAPMITVAMPSKSEFRLARQQYKVVFTVSGSLSDADSETLTLYYKNAPTKKKLEDEKLQEYKPDESEEKNTFSITITKLIKLSKAEVKALRKKNLSRITEFLFLQLVDEEGASSSTNITLDTRLESITPTDDELCGDNEIDEPEQCDGGDGCTETCACAANFVATEPPTVNCQAVPVCGNGILEAGELCDSGTGCSECVCQSGFAANGTVNCEMTCGNNTLDEDEECDGGTGCISDCRCGTGFESNDTVACTPLCGNNKIDSFEACDGGDNCEDCKCTANSVATNPPGLGCQDLGFQLVSAERSGSQRNLKGNVNFLFEVSLTRVHPANRTVKLIVPCGNCQNVKKLTSICINKYLGTSEVIPNQSTERGKFVCTLSDTGGVEETTKFRYRVPGPPKHSTLDSAGGSKRKLWKNWKLRVFDENQQQLGEDIPLDLETLAK